jgi:hypothetical protein
VEEPTSPPSSLPPSSSPSNPLHSHHLAEQERLIQQYAAQDASRNAQFRKALVALPLLAALPYLVCLVARPAAARVALLGLTSLLSTALLAYRQQPAVTGIAPLDAYVRGEDLAAALRLEADRLRQRFGPLALPQPPIDLYLPYLNLVLAALVVLLGFVPGARAQPALFYGMGAWPALFYAISLIVKATMASVDPERTLSALKYGYKGA